jgi:hypothetical protein
MVRDGHGSAASGLMADRGAVATVPHVQDRDSAEWSGSDMCIPLAAADEHMSESRDHA